MSDHQQKDREIHALVRQKLTKHSPPATTGVAKVRSRDYFAYKSGAISVLRDTDGRIVAGPKKEGT